MAKKRLALQTLATGIMCFGLFASSAMACTSIAVSPGASVDRTTSVTQTCDAGGASFDIYKHPAKSWPRGSEREVYDSPQVTSGKSLYEQGWLPTGNFIPQVDYTYGYIAGLFGMVNEKQVAMGESSTSGRRECRNTDGWFQISTLSCIGLERGATAREAIQVMGTLAEEYGFKEGGEMLAVGDPNEAWIFEIAGPGILWSQGDGQGAYWVAQRVPDGHVAACANNAVIDEIDFDDTDNFMYSPGIVEFAIENGWYDPDSGETFSWRKHFMNATNATGSGRRVKRVFSLVAPSLEDELNEVDLPFSVPVDEKLSLWDINKIQADHYEDTEYDARYSLTAGPWNNPRRYRGGSFRVDGVSYSWQRQIAQVQCEYSITTQSRGWLPDAVGAVLWYGPCNPDATCQIPLYASVSELSPILGSDAGSHMVFTRDSFWWSINAVSTYIDMKYSYMIEDFNEFKDKYETSLMKTQSVIDEAAITLYKQDPQLAVDFLTKFCADNAQTVRNAAWDLLDFYIWKYNMGFVTENGRVNTVSYPESWLRRVIELDEPDHFKS